MKAISIPRKMQWLLLLVLSLTAWRLGKLSVIYIVMIYMYTHMHRELDQSIQL